MPQLIYNGSPHVFTFRLPAGWNLCSTYPAVQAQTAISMLVGKVLLICTVGGSYGWLVSIHRRRWTIYWPCFAPERLVVSPPFAGCPSLHRRLVDAMSSWNLRCKKLSILLEKRNYCDVWPTQALKSLNLDKKTWKKENPKVQRMNNKSKSIINKIHMIIHETLEEFTPWKRRCSALPRPGHPFHVLALRRPVVSELPQHLAAMGQSPASVKGEATRA